MSYRTFDDVMRSLRGYVGNDTAEHKQAAVKRAVFTALRKLITYHDWTYYQDIGTVNTVAAVTTGTIAYDHTGGAYERLLTLTDSTWPTWAGSGVIVIDSVPYQAEARKSSTELTLTESSNPGADVAALTTYSLYRCQYPMPADFAAADQLIAAGAGAGSGLMAMQARDFVLGRALLDGPAQPREFCFVGNRLRTGQLDVILWPPPDAAYPLQFLYKRRPAAPTVESDTGGKATVTASSAVVTGSNTTFAARHVGCVFRVSENTQPPTGDDGVNPAAFESRILSVASATSLTLEDALPAAYTNVNYVISSQIDVADTTMYDLVIEGGRVQLRIECRMNMTNEELSAFESAKAAAKAADTQRSKQRVIAGSRENVNNRYPVSPYRFV